MGHLKVEAIVNTEVMVCLTLVWTLWLFGCGSSSKSGEGVVLRIPVEITDKQFKVANIYVNEGEKCLAGSIAPTLRKISNHEPLVCHLLRSNHIVRLADGASMDGPDCSCPSRE